MDRRKKNKVVKGMACALSAVAIMGCVGCGDNNKDPQAGYEIKIDTLLNGAEVDLCHPTIRAYLNATVESEICALLTEFSGKGVPYDYQDLEIGWTSETVKGNCLFHISESEDFSDEYVVSAKGKWKATFLTPGRTYYYKITKEEYSSIVDSFTTVDLPVRNITVSGGWNVRDIGGWLAEGGKKVSYGKLYRGAKLGTGFISTASTSGRTFFNECLGMKSEIDFRTPGKDDDNQETCLWNVNGLYTKAPLTSCHIFEQAVWYDVKIKESMQKIFAHLADENNYPAYFHCNLGADRTGTVAFLLNGVLGVSYEDLAKDFELTSFSLSGKRWRSNIVDGSFTADGIMQNDSDNYVGFGKMYETMMEYYNVDGTLAGAIENYLVSFCKVEKAHIDAFKQIMLGDVLGEK